MSRWEPGARRDWTDLALGVIALAVAAIATGIYEFRDEIGRFFRAFPEAGLAVVLVCMLGIAVTIVGAALRRREP